LGVFYGEFFVEIDSNSGLMGVLGYWKRGKDQIGVGEKTKPFDLFSN
jgi:hypothetical protein